MIYMIKKGNEMKKLRTIRGKKHTFSLEFDNLTNEIIVLTRMALALYELLN